MQEKVRLMKLKTVKDLQLCDTCYVLNEETYEIYSSFVKNITYLGIVSTGREIYIHGMPDTFFDGNYGTSIKTFFSLFADIRVLKDYIKTQKMEAKKEIKKAKEKYELIKKSDLSNIKKL